MHCAGDGLGPPPASFDGSESGQKNFALKGQPPQKREASRPIRFLQLHALYARAHAGRHFRDAGGRDSASCRLQLMLRW